ncbi:aryl-alcohol dehydrogenase-like predicted oxidoreductase [Murinocardiopsis flavida]|uniref:Aryl-alcohol dehydrogenase-like predicted oxidoreductase n=1 Tax=Murinocardiopsis flavida TaxID=645275 RepID=A0A2P8DMH5_9ACTN|nr:aldo/keto reductase [Murinocardiopsis flavida]PSK98415.1 aryl-alcohol dehydrogenase-like predicted oxidoreductase [Murinocardiopsis flavida]
MTAGTPAANTAPTRLPGVDTPLSPLVLGTMTFGDTVDAAGAARMLDTALDAGVTGIDTANGYAGGASEEILRDLLATRRDRVVLATKAGIPHPDAGAHTPLSAQGLRAGLEGSLARLGTDRVDLFYLHQPDRAAPLAETLGTIAALVDEGKIGALGVSNHAAWQIGELNRAADDAGAPRPVVAQQLYNLLARRIEAEYVEFAEVTGLLTMVYNPLCGGLLTGRHRFDEAPSAGRFGDSRLAAMYRERYWDPALFDAVAALSRIAEDAGLPLTDLSLRWLLSKPATGALLLGGSRVAHLEANLAAAAAGPLPADLVAACDAVGAALNGPMPAYNR